MKKVFTTLAFVLAFVLSMTMITACADHNGAPGAESTAAPVQQVTVPTPPPATPAATVPTPASDTSFTDILAFLLAFFRS